MFEDLNFCFSTKRLILLYSILNSDNRYWYYLITTWCTCCRWSLDLLTWLSSVTQTGIGVQYLYIFLCLSFLSSDYYFDSKVLIDYVQYEDLRNKLKETEDKLANLQNGKQKPHFLNIPASQLVVTKSTSRET